MFWLSSCFCCKYLLHLWHIPVDMKDRLQQLIENEHLSPSRFADEVGLNRPAVSHILSGRNKPGFDALQRILQRFPQLNASWLITGEGDMYARKAETDAQGSLMFDEDVENADNWTGDRESFKETGVKTVVNSSKTIDNQKDSIVIASAAKVKKIAVFYTDNTYEEFIPLQKE